MLTESVILGILGGVAGLLLARWGLRALIAVSEASFPRVAGTTIDGQVLAFTILVSLATGLIFGLAPAWQASRSVTHESLKEGARSSTGGAGSQRLRRVLIASEIALSLVLLAGAGLLLKSFVKLQQIDPGFRPQHVLTMRTSLPRERYATRDQIRNFYRDVLARVREISDLVPRRIALSR